MASGRAHGVRVKPRIPLRTFLNVTTPTLTAPANPQPTTLATFITSMGATVGAGSVAILPNNTPARTVLGVTTPTIAAGSNAVPTTLATVAAMDTPTLTGSANVTPTVLATTTGIIAPTVVTGIVVTPSSLITVTNITTPTVTAGSPGSVLLHGPEGTTTMLSGRGNQP